MLNKIEILHKNVKNITLRVKPTLKVTLTVPINTHTSIINEILTKRHDWITQKINYSKEQHNKQGNAIDSTLETVEYLGTHYPVRIVKDTKNTVDIVDGYIEIRLIDITNQNKKLQLIDAFYKEKASFYFNQALCKYTPIVNKDVSRVSIRKMKTRWGSCNPKKSYINLSLLLIKKDIRAIEYVVFHELTHLIHYYHDKHFYGFIHTHMKDWQMRKGLLYLRTSTS